MKSKKAQAALFLSMTGLYFFSYFQRVAIPSSIFNEIQGDFKVSAAAVTALSSIYLYIYAGMQLFIGIFVDVYGGTKVIIISGALLCAGSMIFPFSENLSVLYLSRGLIGLGGSAMYLALVKEIDNIFGTRNFAPFLGLVCVIGYSGGLAGTKPFRALVELAGWRSALFYIALATLAMLCLVIFLRKNAREKPVLSARPPLLKNLGRVLQNRLNLPVMICAPVNFAIFFVIQATVGAKFLQDVTGMSALESTGYTFTMMLITMGCLFLSGILSRLLGNLRKPFLLAASALNLIAVLMLLAGTEFRLSPGFFFTAYILMSVSSGCVTVVVSMLKELNRPDIAVFSIGVQNTLAYVFVALTANSTGVILDCFKASATVSGKNLIYPPQAYMTLFAVLGILAVISQISAFFARETRGTCISD